MGKERIESEIEGGLKVCQVCNYKSDNENICPECGGFLSSENDLGNKTINSEFEEEEF